MGLALVCGCGGRGSRRGGTAALREWLNQQTFSSYGTFKHKGAQTEYPASPDGLTLGSPNVFAAVGTDPEDLSSLEVFWGDSRTVRPLAKPLTLSLRARGRGLPRGRAARLISFSALPDQTLRRVRHTAIAVSESSGLGLRITCVDFAPMAAQENYLARWFLVENTGKAARTVSLDMDITAQGEWRALDARSYQVGERLALVSNTRLHRREERIELRVGTVRPGRGVTAAVLLVATEPKKLPADVEQARSALKRLPELLEATKTDWEEWCARTPLRTGDARMDDLLD
jgi:hypothetical protein